LWACLKDNGRGRKKKKKKKNLKGGKRFTSALRWLLEYDPLGQGTEEEKQNEGMFKFLWVSKGKKRSESVPK